MADSEQTSARAGGVSRRAVVLAFVLLVLIAPAAFYGELAYGATYMFASGVPAMAPLVLLFLLLSLIHI